MRWQTIGLAIAAFLGTLFFVRRVADDGGDGSGGAGEGPGPVDPYATWDTTKEGQCDPTAKPGVLLFRRWALGKWGEKEGSPQNIVRGCDVGGPSEHKEGRAWDMMTRGIEHGQSVVDALTAGGDELARRAGIMYMIWNHQMWRAYPWQGAPSGTWTAYSAGEAASPHVDHIHFSFSRAGAAGETSLYDRLRAEFPTA